MCPWDNTPRRHLPLLKGKFQHVSDLSAVHFIPSSLHSVEAVQSALDCICASREQQSLPAEVGDASKPVAPSPASSFLFGLQPSPRCLYRVLWDKTPAVFSRTPGKQNLAHPPGDLFFHSSLQATTLTYGLASFPPFASHFLLTVFKIVQTHLFPLSRVPDERFPGS